MGWVADTLGDAVRLTFDVTGAAWSQKILVTSDRHLDNPHSRRDIAKRHYQWAMDCNAPILDLGDMFDAMQSRDDPRRDYSTLSERHKKTDYINQIVGDVAEFLKPYTPNLVVLLHGNHETAVRRKLGVDLTAILRHQLAPANAWPFVPGYGCYVQLSGMYAGRRMSPYTLRLFHGSGGGGPVTKGVIQTNRRAVMYPDADMIITGHVHESWRVTTRAERISQRGRVTYRHQVHVCVPTSKDEFTPVGGYHVESGRAPRPLGSVALDLSITQNGANRVMSVSAVELE